MGLFVVLIEGDVIIMKEDNKFIFFYLDLLLVDFKNILK